LNAIPSITPITELQTISAGKQEKVQESSFASVFESAISYVRDTDAEKNAAEYLLATGQLDNPAVLTIASTKNQIAVELLVQLRSRALDAYSELTRISL